MKRILAMLLAVVMMFGLLAGCGDKTPDPTTEPTVAPTQDTQPDPQLEKAIEYLRTFYKNAAEKTPMDYTRLGAVRIGITTYDIVWSVDVDEEVLKIVKNEDGTYTIDINEETNKDTTEPTPYVLTATITGKDGRELSISWNHIIPAAIDEDAITAIKNAYALASGETLEGTYTVTGVIKAIKTPYDPSYMNITVTIEVAGAEDMPVVCYRLKGDGADKLAVGDTITVTGSLMNYNGQIQFAAGCILEAVESGGGAAPVAPENPVDILKQAYALAPGESLPYNCSLSGVITFVDQAYSPDYGNITVTMKSNGYTIKCYRIKGDGVDQLNVNDEITVSGVITNYNGTIEFAAGSMLISRVDHEPPAKMPDPTPGSSLTVLQAYNIGMGKDHDTYTEGSYYITGTIVSIENESYGNMHISDGTGKLMIYGTWSEDGNTRYDKLSPKPTVGDTVTLYGKIGRYGSNPQMKNAWIIGAKGDTPVIPDAPSVDKVTELVAGTPYRFGMAQGNLENAVYYLAGGMDGFYMKTTADPAAAINVYVEETAGGYYFYTLSGETKLYINMVVSADGAHVNGAYEATASTVYTYDTTLIATVDGVPYWFGTRNDKTYTTMGPCKVELAGFFGEFYVGSEETPEQPEEPEDPTEPAAGLEEGVAYTISAVNGKGTLWFNGTLTSGRFNGSYNESEAVLVYAENVEGGFLLYFMDGETKQYICIADTSSGGSFGTDAASATVFEWNADKATAAVAEDSNNRGFGVGATSTYDNFSAYDLSGTYNWGQFTAVGGGNTEPDVPACEHKNTTVEGAVEATCTTDGHTGKTVCTDCGETVNAGDVIPATGHNFVNGTCTKCGEAESEEPETPAEPTYVTSITAGTAYKLGLFSTSKNATYYFMGTMSGYYGATETVYADGVDVFVEDTTDGYYLYFLDANGAKQYINLVASGTYRNFTFATTASSVYTWNAEKNALYTTVEGEICYIGTYGTYVTMGVLQTAKLKDTDYIARLYTIEGSSEPDVPTCEHKNTKVEGAVEATCTTDGHTGKTVCVDCGETVNAGSVISSVGHNFVNGTCTKCGETDPNYTPDEPEQPTTGLKEGVGYTISAVNGTGTLWFNGTVTSGRFNGSYNESEAVLVYAENVEGGFLLYFMDGATKQYICIEDKSAGGSFSTDVASATVFEWNAEKATAAVAEDSNNRAFGVGATSTYANFSAYDLTGTYNWGQYTPVEGGSTEPDVPTCEHKNTKVEGAVEATCTTDGHTGKTVCVDCGETVNAGDVIPATGHNFVNGTCTKCGEADPNYTPDEPEEPATGLKEGVAYTISAANGTGTLWFNGTVGSGRFNGSYNESEAVLVYAENVDGGFLLYFMNGETKQYICMADSSTGGSFSTDAASATVFEWNADKATAAVAEDSNNRGFGCQATSTYSNFSCYDLSNNYNWGQFIPVEGGSTEPEDPFCQHLHTDNKGYVEATCTTDGYTGDTVCTDCGDTISKGNVVTATGHNFVNGTCTKCGEAESEEPSTPAEPTYVTSITAGTAYKLGLFSTSKNATYYFMGTMSGYYGATETVYADGVDVFVEDTTDGYYLYFLDANGAKLYINLVASGTYRNFTYATTASSVYTWNAEKNALYTTVEGEICYIGTYGSYVTMGVLQTAKLKDTDYIARLYTIGGSSEPEAPEFEHVIENGGGYAASLSEDGTQLDCYQFGNEGAIFYTNYFTEKPAEGYYELREYNGKFYYTSAPSWGVIAYESITISGKTAQLKMYDDEAMVELELIAENQYKITTGNDSLPAGLVFTFGAEYCEVLGHLGVRNCEEDVKCNRCETVICGPTGHEYGEDGVCFRCFSAMRPEEPAAPAGDKADFGTIVLPSSKQNGDSSYTASYTTANGWVTTNSAIQCGGTADINPQFTVIGPDNTHKAPCLNGGKTVGSITSPTLTGGISKLTMKYTKIFTDKKLAVTITITDVATGTKYTHTVERDVANDAKYTVWDAEWILETPVTGDFTIEVVNSCPSGGSTSKNQDRITILELAWEGAVAAHEHSYTVTSTATCTADGEATYTCECGDSYTEAASKLGHIDENLDVECDREGCTSKVAPAANSKLSTFTANCLGSKLSTDYQYYVEGTIVEVLDTKNGIFLIDDGTGETFYFRLPKNAEGVSHANWEIKLTLGDKVSVYGKINKYSSNTAPNGQFWPAIQGGVVTVLEQHPHDFTFTPATCSAPAYCACGQSHGEPLGCADNNGDDLCDDCGKNVKLVYEYIAIRTDNGSGVHDATAYTYTWSNANFDVQVAKASGGNLYVTAKDHMRLYKGNQLILANKNGITVKTITVYLTNATQVTNFEKFLTGYTYTKDAENFTITIEVNSAATLTLLNPSSNGSTTQIKGVEFGYEK